MGDCYDQDPGDCEPGHPTSVVMDCSPDPVLTHDGETSTACRRCPCGSHGTHVEGCTIGRGPDRLQRARDGLLSATRILNAARAAFDRADGALHQAWRDRAGGLDMAVGYLDDKAAIARQLGTEPPAGDLPEQVIEAVAMALYEHSRDDEHRDPDYDWPHIDTAYDRDDEEDDDPQWLRNRFRAQARVALEAAQSLAALMLLVTEPTEGAAASEG